MRSSRAFFQDDLTLSLIERAANTSGRLLLYCGAGVTIDRTGHSWGSLVLSLLPERKHKTRPDMPTRAQVECLTTKSPEALASSVVYLLRDVSGGGEKLQRTLRTRLRSSLYQEKGRWQNGRVVEEIILLAALRSNLERDTIVLTTNYDTYLEEAYDRLRENVPDIVSMPGLRVFRAGSGTPVRVVEPSHRGSTEPGAFLDIVYLHGRLPRAGQGIVSWPLVLDENSYASTAPLVETAIRDALAGSSLALLLGTSVTDTPLVRALSVRPRGACERVALLLRDDFAHTEGPDEMLALEMARNRASELGVQILFPDFPGQVAQLVREVMLRQVYEIARPDEPKTLPYAERVDAWWAHWSQNRGSDPKLTKRLRRVLALAYRLTTLVPPATPLDVAGERLQVELWVREGPVGARRSLRRWVRSTDSRPDGMAGKVAPLERGSYLAPIRAFVDGRPKLIDVTELDGGRHEVEQYTWKSFLCVPVRVHGAMVGVIGLASTRAVSESAMNRDAETTSFLVAALRAEGERLLSSEAR